MSQDKGPPVPPPVAPADETPPFQPDPELVTYLEKGKRPDEVKASQPDNQS